MILFILFKLFIAFNKLIIARKKKMNICCEQTVVRQDEEYYLYKGYSNSQHTRVPIRQSQVNPIISKTQQPYRLVLKSRHQKEKNDCQQSKKQFVDKEFPANQKSLGSYVGKRKIEWIRLSKILQKIGKQIYHPLQILSMKQGDSFFLASLAALSSIPSSIQQAFDQQLSISQVGAYSLNLNIKGKPQQIVIDDYLPVFSDNKKRGVFCSIDPEIIWVPLFQKAYAKINGSYEAIQYGYAHTVLSTFSKAPCTYQIIPTDFRHHQQDKCWKYLLYVTQMAFPIVAGSRKNNSSIIIPNQTYCIKNCELIQKSKTQQKRIILWNLPGKRIEAPNPDIRYEENGSTISLTVVQFMRNFQVLDIAHVRKHFSSHFYQFKFDTETSFLYEFTTTLNSVLYLTLQKIEGQKGKLRIMLISCSTEATYQYIAGKREEIYSDVTIHVEALPPGNYIVICQSSSRCSCLLRVYSPIVIPLVKFSGNKMIILERTFMQLAYSSASEQIKLSKKLNDWYLSKILFDDIGLAFLMVNLDRNSLIKCELSFNRIQLLEEGIDIANKQVKQGYTSSFQKGQSDILIFDFIGKTNQAYNFPPNSLKINLKI